MRKTKSTAGLGLSTINTKLQRFICKKMKQNRGEVRHKKTINVLYKTAKKEEKERIITIAMCEGRYYTNNLKYYFDKMLAKIPCSRHGNPPNICIGRG